MPFWRKNAMGKVPVVGNQYKPLCILIQPACGKQARPPVFLRYQIQHRRLLRIPGGTQNSGGFIHHQIQVFPEQKRLSIQFQRIGIQIDFCIRRYRSMSIMLHPAPAKSVFLHLCGNIASAMPEFCPSVPNANPFPPVYSPVLTMYNVDVYAKRPCKLQSASYSNILPAGGNRDFHPHY